MYKEIEINTDYIKLDQLLKFIGVVQTGGESKILIAEGLVKINDEIEYKRGRKIIKGDKIEIKDIDKYIVI